MYILVAEAEGREACMTLRIEAAICYGSGVMKVPVSDATLQERKLDALFEEYRALYGLVTFRMSAMDRRLPITAGAMAAVIISLNVVSVDTQLLLLISLPPALIWFVRATVNHVRSFEDVLRRIEEIELSVNAIVGSTVMRFQSRHPSRGREIGGRTGRESVSAVIATSLLMLAASAFRMHRSRILPHALEAVYVVVLGLLGVLSLLEGVRLSRYRYDPPANLADRSTLQ